MAGESGLSTVFRALVGAGRPLLVESPSYWGAILAAAQSGVRVVPVPSGVDGPDPEELARAFAQTGARAFYAQPNFADPTRAGWSSGLADHVLDALREHVPTASLEAVPRGGLNLWLCLPGDTGLPRLVRDCEAAGVAVAAGDDWFPAEPSGPHLRVDYSGPNPGALPEGARIIGETLERQSGRSSSDEDQHS